MEGLSDKGEGMYTMSLHILILKDKFIITCQYEFAMTEL